MAPTIPQPTTVWRETIHDRLVGIGYIRIANAPVHCIGVHAVAMHNMFYKM